MPNGSTAGNKPFRYVNRNRPRSTIATLLSRLTCCHNARHGDLPIPRQRAGSVLRHPTLRDRRSGGRHREPGRTVHRDDGAQRSDRCRANRGSGCRYSGGLDHRSSSTLLAADVPLHLLRVQRSDRRADDLRLLQAPPRDSPEARARPRPRDATRARRRAAAGMRLVDGYVG